MSSTKKRTAKRSASKARTKKDDREPVPCPECLPCPFCGSTPTIQLWHGGGPQKRMIMCEGEDCGHDPSITGPTKRTAIALWNRRAPSPADRAVETVECIREYADRLLLSPIPAQAGVGTRLMQMIAESTGNGEVARAPAGQQTRGGPILAALLRGRRGQGGA